MKTDSQKLEVMQNLKPQCATWDYGPLIWSMTHSWKGQTDDLLDLLKTQSCFLLIFLDFRRTISKIQPSEWKAMYLLYFNLNLELFLYVFPTFPNLPATQFLNLIQGSKQRKFVREGFWRVWGIFGGYLWRSFPYTNPRINVETHAKILETHDNDWNKKAWCLLFS